MQIWTVMHKKCIKTTKILKWQRELKKNKAKIKVFYNQST